MGRAHAGGTDIFVDEFDFSGVVNACDIAVNNPIADVTAFTDVDLTFVEGKPSFSITLNGLYSTAAPDYDGEMFIDLTASDRLITVSPSIAAATGGTAYFGQGDITSLPETATIVDAVALNVTWNGNKPLSRGRIMCRAAAQTISVDSTAYNMGACTANQQLIAFQHVMSAGTGTLDTIIVSDSQADMLSGGVVTRITFAQAAAATSQRVVDAGVNADIWYRAELTIAGATPVFNVIIVLAIVDYNP